MGCNRKTLLTGAAIAGLIALPATALAQAASSPSGQTSSTPPPSETKASPSNNNQVIVTGSRIKRTTFTSPAPISVVTAEQAQLEGAQDVAQILQLLPVAANGEQINNFFSGYVQFPGGPGANTLALRGLGAQRTLILVNGERLGPAGVSGYVGPIDLNVIPESEIDHVEIEKDGASSIYGSDAVAGVVNIITKTNQDGGDLHVYGDPSERGGGNVYQVNGSWGKTGDKGYITLGFDYYRQDPLLYRDRSYLSCPEDLVTYQNGGGSADLIDPTTGKDKCFNAYGFAPAVEDLALPVPNVYIPNKSAVGGGGPLGIDLPGWQAVGLQLFNPDGSINVAGTRASQAMVPQNDPSFDNTDAISPVSRYSFNLFGGWNLTPHLQAYTSFIFNERDSSQTYYSQFFGYVNPGNPYNPGFNFPLPIVEQNEPDTQRVDYGRIVVGLKGDLPNWNNFKNWTFDLYGQYALDDGSYTQTYVPQDRANAVTWAGPGTNGCDVNAVSPYIGGESMAQAEPGVACVPVNLFAAVQNGQFTPAEQAFLYRTTTGHTTYEHGYIEGDFNGDVWQLPAGPLSAAVGFLVLRESIDDNPGADFINENVYNESTSGITKGSETSEDIYGELRIPLVRDVRFIDDLSVDISGRFSNYSTYGADLTYKGTADWKLTDWFALRATYGTAFRAPELFELYIANSTGFLTQNEVDPCINYGVSGVSPVIQKNCAALGIPSNYQGLGESATVLAGGGAGHLRAETSIAQTEGFVLSPHWGDQSIKIALDYYSFDIKNQINQFGAGNIVLQCMEANNFPNNPFCSLFTRNGATGPNAYSISLINDDYVNVSKETDQGIDLDITYKSKLPYDVDLTIDTSLYWTFDQNIVLLNGAVSDALGSIGSPTFVGTANARFDKGPWTFNWFVYMIGHSDDADLSTPIIPNYRDTGQTVIANYNTPLYTVSTVSLRRKFDKFTVEFGVKNVLNQTPPAISAFDSFEGPRVGNSASAVSQYDLIGRSYFVSLDAKF